MSLDRAYTTACMAKLNFKQREFIRAEISPKLLHIERGPDGELDLVATAEPSEGAMDWSLFDGLLVEDEGPMKRVHIAHVDDFAGRASWRWISILLDKEGVELVRDIFNLEPGHLPI